MPLMDVATGYHLSLCSAFIIQFGITGRKSVSALPDIYKNAVNIASASPHFNRDFLYSKNSLPYLFQSQNPYHLLPLFAADLSRIILTAELHIPFCE